MVVRKKTEKKSPGASSQEFGAGLDSAGGKPAKRRSASSGTNRRTTAAKSAGDGSRKPTRRRSSGSRSRSRRKNRGDAGSAGAGKAGAEASRSTEGARDGQEKPARKRTRRRRRPARGSQRGSARSKRPEEGARDGGDGKKTGVEEKAGNQRRRPEGKGEEARQGGKGSQGRRRSSSRRRKKAPPGAKSPAGKGREGNERPSSQQGGDGQAGEKKPRRRSRSRRRGGAKKKVADSSKASASVSAETRKGRPAAKSKPGSSGGGSERRRGRGKAAQGRKPSAARKRPEKEKSSVVRKILINAVEPEEIRIGIVEDGRLDQLYYERAAEEKYLGNIYKGRIVNVEPAIQAAFIDLGIRSNGFLHVSDVLGVYKDSTVVPVDRLSERVPGSRDLKIQDILRKGQDILVQISKDSIGLKGPSLTTYVSVPGKYLVLMPGINRHGVSKRIRDGAERSALRKKLASLDPPEGMGYIVRTAGEEESAEMLKKDFSGLMETWTDIVEKVRTRRTPSLLFQESDLVTRSLRDLFDSSVEEILIDEKTVYEHGKEFLLDVMPQAAERLQHYTGKTPLFTKFGIEQQIERIYNRRIQLPSGGWIILEQTEALVAIDVNSGKYRKELDLESTALKTNIEAAEVICQELRLRDLGGLVVIDFIDMEKMPNRRELEQFVKKCLSTDKAKSWITRVSRFGIIEMTRQRVRPSFESSNHVACSDCEGTGWVKSPTSAGIEILRRLRGELGQRQKKTCEITTGPDVTDYLCKDRRRNLDELEKDYNKKIVVKNDPKFGSDKYTIRYR